MKTLLSLFDYTGNWSFPYAENGWTVFQVDIKHGIDILDINTEWLYENIFDDAPNGTVNGILAAPPCTDFASSGAQYWKQKDADGRTEKSLALVKQVFKIVDVCLPDFWAMENPVGRLPKLLPELSKPWYFQPYWFGDAYVKKTGLWGNFNKPEITNVVKPEKVCQQGSWIMKLGGKSEHTKELRSQTPEGFAWAFYAANH
jgi:hypothetical protein